MNTGQTSVVIELSEQTVIEKLVARLTSRYPELSQSTVETVVHDVHARFDGSPLRDYIPLLVERNAKTELARLHASAGKLLSASARGRGDRVR